MIEQADIDCAQRTVPGDVCFTASALAGHVIRILEEEGSARGTIAQEAKASESSRKAALAGAGATECARETATEGEREGAKAHAKQHAEKRQGNFLIGPKQKRDYPSIDFKLDAGRAIEIPYVCEQCLLDSLPSIVRHATGVAPNIRWTAPWPTSAADTAEAASAASASDAADATSAAEATAAGAAATARAADPADTAEATAGTPAHAHASRSQNPKPRVGIVGNALLCFDAFMNDNIIAFIENQGCTVVLPDPALLFTEDVRYLPQLDRFAEQGVNHVIYLQSFGCLKGHVQARGSLHELSQRYPAMPITVIDYDPEASALNRENRIRLALCAAQDSLQS